MLIKVIRGRNPSDLCRYVLDPRKQKTTERAMIEKTGNINTIVFCSSMPGQTVSQLSSNFRLLAQLNSRVDKIVAHYSISLHPSEAQQVGLAQMRAISRTVLNKLGHSRCPYFAVEHHDANQKHWHLVSGTIGYDGKWVSDSFDRYRLRLVEQEVQKEFQLPEISSQHGCIRQNLTTGEYRQKVRTGEVLPKEKLWKALDDCIQPDMSLGLLLLTLKARYPEISIRLKRKNSRTVGISFGIDDKAFAGRSLGSAYSLNGLISQQGIKHSHTDSTQLEQVLALSSSECRNLLSQLNKQTQHSYTANSSEQLEIDK